MKKQMKLIALCSILAVTVACQPKRPMAPTSRFAEVNQVRPITDTTEEDIDDAVYGTNDTSSSYNQETNFDSTQMISDFHEVSETVPSFDAFVAEDANEGNVVVLEAVNPVEIEPQYQEEVSEYSQN